MYGLAKSYEKSLKVAALIALIEALSVLHHPTREHQCSYFKWRIARVPCANGQKYS